MELVAEYADRVVLMKQGKILLDGPTANVFSNPDEINEAGIIPPLISKLTMDLRKQGIDAHPLLTVSELINFLVDICKLVK